jgi:uncharacterized protein
MEIVLSPVEVRVLGSLVEKELTTPEYYPLSLHALVAACNQKSNRDPVMSLSGDDVSMAIGTLRGKNLAWQLNTAGGRVPKFEHNLPARLAIAAQDESASDAPLPSDGDAATRVKTTSLMRRELAVLAALMLRGPLTAGEIRGVTGRMHPFKDIPETEETLAKLMKPESGPLVVKLAKQAGRKEQRYAHCFSGALAPQAETIGAPQANAPAPAGSVNDRFLILEKKVGMLADEIAAMKQAFEEFRKSLEG